MMSICQSLKHLQVCVVIQDKCLYLVPVWVIVSLGFLVDASDNLHEKLTVPAHHSHHFIDTAHILKLFIIAADP